MRATRCSHKVLVPANFKDHTFVASDSDALLAAGYCVGMTVVLSKRITVEFADDKKRRDVQKGTKVVIKGMSGESPVVTVSAEFGKRMLSADVAVKLSNIEKLAIVTDETDRSGGASAGSSSSTTCPKNVRFLLEGAGVVDVIQHWSKMQLQHDPKIRIGFAQNTLQFAIACVSEQCPVYTEKDFTICTRGGEYEVWTMRPFKAKEIQLPALSNDLRDRFWTTQRSAPMANGDNVRKWFGCDRKPMVIDGRFRSSVSDSRSFALFWVVERTEDDLAGNLEMQTAVVTITAGVTLPNQKEKSLHLSGDSSPGVPIMTNMKAIKEHTKLICKEDMDFKKLCQKLQGQALKEKEKDAELKRKDDEGKCAKDEGTGKGAKGKGAKKAKIE